MIAVSGASGFVGRAVCRELELRRLHVLRIGRRNADISWPANGEFGDDALAQLAGVRAVVHLAGETIGVRWTAARKRAIQASRAGLTGVLARALGQLAVPPEVLVSASAVGIYGSCGDEWLDESRPPGTDFLAVVARDWEAATEPARLAGVRVVHLRLGVVLGPGGGMLARIALPFQLGGGATFGPGTQWMSWISLDDAVRLILRALDDTTLAGPVNLVSPEPARNVDFTRAVARAFRRPALFTVPAPALRLAFGEMADGMLLASQRARPSALERAGFAFAHPGLDVALAAAVRQ